MILNCFSLTDVNITKSDRVMDGVQSYSHSTGTIWPCKFISLYIYNIKKNNCLIIWEWFKFSSFL